MPTSVAATQQLRRLGVFLSVASLSVILAATLIPQSGHPESSPFCIICGSLGGVDALLNIFLFLPLGVGLALSGVRTSRAFASIFLLSASIEIAQYLAISGRDASVGDVISNSLGGAFGFAAAHYARHWLLPSRRAAMTLALVWGGFWILIQLGSSYALAPSLPPTRYYGQVARELENFATFKGSVISPTIGNTTVPDYGFAKTAEFRDNLARGEFVSAIVIPAGPTPKLAPIIRVADDRRQEIVLLAQRHRDLVFGLRTGASTLRLRGLLFMLGDVFPTGSDGSNASDTLRLSGRYDARLVEMRVTNRRESRDRALAVDPGLAWALILPNQWYFAGTTLEWILTRIWMALLLVPLGYWLTFASATGVPDASRTGFLRAPGAIVLLWVGFAVVPPHFGIPRAPLASWVTAVAGLLTGVVIAFAAGPRSVHQPLTD